MLPCRIQRRAARFSHAGRIAHAAVALPLAYSAVS
jgi:hypothetical protein